MLLVVKLTNFSYQNIGRLLGLIFLDRSLLGENINIKFGDDLWATVVVANVVHKPTQKNREIYD